MYVCMYVCIYVCMLYACMHAGMHACMCIYIYTQVCFYVITHVHMHIKDISDPVHAYIYVHTHHVYLYICDMMYVICTYIDICIHADRLCMPASLYIYVYIDVHT